MYHLYNTSELTRNSILNFRYLEMVNKCKDINEFRRVSLYGIKCAFTICRNLNLYHKYFVICCDTHDDVLPL